MEELFLFFRVTCALFTHHFHVPHKSGSHSPQRSLKTSFRKIIKYPVGSPDLFVALTSDLAFRSFAPSSSQICSSSCGMHCSLNLLDEIFAVLVFL